MKNAVCFLCNKNKIRVAMSNINNKDKVAHLTCVRKVFKARKLLMKMGCDTRTVMVCDSDKKIQKKLKRC